MIDRFHISPAQFAHLTDRQIFELYLHPRNEEGGIDLSEPARREPKQDDEPEAPPSFETDLAALQMARDALKMEPKAYRELLGKLEAKYGRTPTVAG